jgi:hypothetical protein
VAVQNNTRSPITATIEYPGDSEFLSMEVNISEPMGVAEFPHLFSYEVTQTILYWIAISSVP